MSTSSTILAPTTDGETVEQPDKPFAPSFMGGGPTNPSWTAALNIYDDLHRRGWQDIPAFRELVAKIAEAPETAGLTAVTSCGDLLISP